MQVTFRATDSAQLQLGLEKELSPVEQEYAPLLLHSCPAHAHREGILERGQLLALQLPHTALCCASAPGRACIVLTKALAFKWLDCAGLYLM